MDQFPIALRNRADFTWVQDDRVKFRFKIFNLFPAISIVHRHNLSISFNFSK